eukprot:Sspe_Gene.98483::Locus_71900_Transcript_2_3_Confidence_0.400_Length_1193::g.98483::m.98483
MGCGASAAAECVEQRPDTSVRRRWTCMKCTLRNTAAAESCGACGALPPPPSPTAWEAKADEHYSSTRAAQITQWAVGDAAEAYVEGQWVPCTVVERKGATVDVSIEGSVWTKDISDIRKPYTDLAECCICLDPLCLRPLGAFCAEGGRRSCRHYLHYKCAMALPHQTCPMCRTPYQHIVQVPRVDRHPHEWFTMANLTRSGALSNQELKDILSGSVAMEQSKVADLVDRHWKRFDGETATLQFEQVRPLVTYLRRHSEMLHP